MSLERGDDSRMGSGLRWPGSTRVSQGLVAIMVLLAIAIGGSDSAVAGAQAVLKSDDTASPIEASPSETVFRDCSDVDSAGIAICPELVVIPAGHFQMGSPSSEESRHGNEGPRHLVSIAAPLAVGRFAVTFGEWDACAAAGGCGKRHPADKGWGRGWRPVVNVSWDDAHQYVAWLSQYTGQPYRLLSEAEWEYAARAGSTTARYWGDSIGRKAANCNGCGSAWDGGRTAPVGSFPPNRFGLFDMLGNVWQWVEDCYHDDYNGAPVDGSAWTSGRCGYRMLRGGSWFTTSNHLRSAYRGGSSSSYRGDDQGFRVARPIQSKTSP